MFSKSGIFYRMSLEIRLLNQFARKISNGTIKMHKRGFGKMLKELPTKFFKFFKRL